MRFKSFLCGVVAASVMAASVTAFAVDFPDILGHWSESYVKAMVDEGYIKGYEDGTFKPDKTVSNTEALILISRMLGVEKSANEDTVDNALAAYSSLLSKYDTKYKDEMSYLLYRGVIDEDDLDTYISSANKDKALLRYQCAVLITKLLGAEDEVGGVFLSSSYSDTAQIPAEARPYVEYVRDAKIMEGMGVDSYGDPVFGPNESVTRGQMAKMLSSLIDVLDITSVNGTITALDAFNETVTVKNKAYSLDDKTIVKLDGEDAKFSDLAADMEARIFILRDKVAMIEGKTPEVAAAPIRGIIVSATNNSEGKNIVVSDVENTSKRTTYKVSDDAKVLIEKAVDSFNKLKSNQYVELTLKGGVATQIEVINKTVTVSGTFVSKDINSKTPTVTIESSKGVKSTYECSADGVDVTRNDMDANLFDVVAGDDVTLKLVYNKVTKITAESEMQNYSGKIESITHMVSGTIIKFDIDGKTKEFSMSPDAIITIDGSAGTVYGLRPGSAVTLRAESSKVTKLETTQAAAVNKISGKVTSVQSKNNFIVVESNGKEVTVVIDASANIANGSTGEVMKLSAIKVGAEVEINGSNSTGTFIAKVIVVNQ